MARQVRPWSGKSALPQVRFEHVVVIRARSANSIRDRGCRLAKVRMYGRNLYPTRRHELRAWQTGGVHVCGRATGVTRSPTRSYPFFAYPFFGVLACTEFHGTLSFCSRT